VVTKGRLGATGATSFGVASLAGFAVADGAGDPLRAVAGGAFPPPGWVRSRYAKGSLLGAYLAHYGRVGKVCLRTARGALAR